MIQTAIKVLTLVFFFSIISGFILYRSGFFDAEDPHYALQKSPNGGELNTVSTGQDTIQIEQIKATNEFEIMPSSKSLTPAFDLKKYEQQKKRAQLPSTKVMLHPIQIEPGGQDLRLKPVALENPYVSSSKSLILTDVRPSWFDISERNREAIKVQPKLIPNTSSEITEDKIDQKDSIDAIRLPNQIEKLAEPKVKADKPKGISWGLIGLGVLGIFFVAIGSIVYFKKRSK